MRITAQAKIETRDRILERAARLFAESGWENTTTREIASAAGIATGTLFNYFQCKEAIAVCLISEAVEEAEREFAETDRDSQSLEEELFAFIWAGLKQLRKYRNFLAPAAETIFSPLAQFSHERTGDGIRVRHLERVQSILFRHGVPAPTSIAMQLYWTLYLGVFACWSADPSPNQEDSLALLDQSLNLFVASLRRGNDQRESE